MVRMLLAVWLCAVLRADTLLPKPAGTDYEQGCAAGKLAARGKGGNAFWWTSAASCASGVVGFVAISSGGGDSPLVPWVPPVIGILGGAATGAELCRDSVPRSGELPELLVRESQAYRQGFVDGYGQSVRAQRRHKAIAGTALGTGLATLAEVVLIIGALIAGGTAPGGR